MDDGFLSDDEYTRKKSDLINASNVSKNFKTFNDLDKEGYGSNSNVPAGRVVHVDIASPKHHFGVASAPSVKTIEGKLLCSKCGDCITTKVVEVDCMPYDTICAKMLQVEDSKVKITPSLGVADPGPNRTYVNRKGERELAEIHKQNDQYERTHNRQANEARARIEKVKDERAKKLVNQK